MAWDECLEVVTSVWPTEWVRIVETRRDEAQAKIRKQSCRPRGVPR
jgi:hypothetical protein